MLEKRKLARVKFTEPVYMRNQDGDEIATMALNYSLRGVGVCCATAPRIGEILDLRFYVNADSRPREIHMWGEVRYVHPDADIYYAGLAFYREDQQSAGVPA